MLTAPVDTSSFTPAQLSAFNAANKLGTGVPTVSTTPPTGTVSTSAPMASPVTVVNAQPAIDTTNKTIADLNQMSIAQADKNNQVKAANDKAATEAAAAAQKQKTQAPISPADQAAKDIASQPDVGNQFVYNTQTGEKQQIAANTPAPQGFSTTNPNGPAVATAQGATFTYKQLSDGTYGRYDLQGNYIGTATQQDFQNTQTANKVQDKINQIALSNFVLSPDEQAQIDNVKAIYAQYIKDQQTANANLTGGTTIAMNRGGMGAQISGAGIIAQTITDGINKVTDLSNKMQSTISQMTTAFKNDDLKALNTAYGNYQQDQSARQTQLNKMNDDVRAQIKEQEQMQAQQQAAAQQQEATRVNAIDNDIRSLGADLSKAPGATQEQKDALKAALDNHDYNAAVAAVGNSLETASGWMGDYLAYRKDAVATKAPTIMTPVQFKNWDDNNKKAIAKAGASYTGVGGSALPQGTEIPFQSTIDSALNNVSQSARGPLKTELYSLAQKGDYVSLLNRVEQNSKKQLTAADQTIVEGEQKSLPYLSNLSAKLKEYQAANGDLGIVSGTEQDIAAKFGQLAKSNPQYAALASELQIMFQAYRKEMTGAAFSAAESREYGAVVPTANKSLNLNMALLEGLKNSKEAGIDGAYSSLLPAGSYLNLKSKADEQTANGATATHPAVDAETTARTALGSFQAASPNNQTAMDALRKAHPDWSAAQTYQTLKDKGYIQ